MNYDNNNNNNKYNDFDYNFHEYNNLNHENIDNFSNINNTNNKNKSHENSNNDHNIDKNLHNSSNGSNNQYGENDSHKYNDSNNNIVNITKPVDVRIIVGDARNSEFLSKAIKNFEMGDDFKIAISSIITTNNIEIAKNAVQGADIVLIASNYNENGKNIFSKFFNALKSEINYVEFLKFPKSRDLEITDMKIIEEEIKNSIIRAGLDSIFNISDVNHIKADLIKANLEYEDLLSNNDKLSMENDVIIAEAQDLREENKNLLGEIKTLQNHIDEIKLDFSDFKDRFSNIHMKNLLEIFPLSNLWEEVFNEPLKEEDKIVIATDKFKPENIVIGQGWIGANSREEAIEWIKIVRTALIFVEDNQEDLEEEFSNHGSRYNSNLDRNMNSNFNPTESNGDGSDEIHKNQNTSKYSNRRYKNGYSEDGEDDDAGYDIPNDFQNFWE
ncbi:hypothetical protein MBCUT_19750 [Methanobrevibacter cuticularis]|uniref:Uncharacterized protein n=1 Tax=Methanobrevibacter cuticularis TaxID=47311 RepID=A0A166CMN6_9EURY|nr:hypothetical protein [Methanobrevibacter cuticularis]KZX14670.1 hypothetical protein MBCUT_19750 [Methanobrevibacter cuticularis]